MITKNSQKHQVCQLFEIETRGHDTSVSPHFQGKNRGQWALGAIHTNLLVEYGKCDLALLMKVSEETKLGSSEEKIKTRRWDWVRTVSTEGLGEGGRVWDVVRRVLLWHQGDNRPICYLTTIRNNITANYSEKLVHRDISKLYSANHRYIMQQYLTKLTDQPVHCLSNAKKEITIFTLAVKL